MRDTLFRAYDLRGIVGVDFVLDEVPSLARACAQLFREQASLVQTIIIGRDARNSSPEIHALFVEELLRCGFSIMDIGICPTPLMYCALAERDATYAGIMITASHNGAEYNGFKITLFDGPLSEEQLQYLNVLRTRPYRFLQRGVLTTYDMHSRYCQLMLQQFAHLKNFSARAVIDCGNGATGVIIPTLIAALELQDIIVINQNLDGNFPAHEPDPTVSESIACVTRELQRTQYAMGVGFDGDGDRMVSLTAQYGMVGGDELLLLFAQESMRINPEPCTVVFDVKCSQRLIKGLTDVGITPQMIKTGHSHIKRAIKKYRARMGGELSCHFFFNDRYFGFDDGIYAMLRLFELVQSTGKTLDDLVSILPRAYATPEIRIACAPELMDSVIAAVISCFERRPDAKLMTLDGVRVEFPYGWGLVRVSHTQPVLSLRCEASAYEDLRRIQHDFYDCLAPYLDHALLSQALPQKGAVCVSP